jgi:hypothetical protein
MPLIDINWKPSPRQLREFGWVASAFLVGLAAWLYGRWGSWLPGILLLTGTAGLMVVTLRGPHYLRPLYIGTLFISFPIGWLGSHLILAVIYFGVFSTTALIFRVLGRDALERSWQPEAPSYWQPKRTSSDMGQYLKQF